MAEADTCKVMAQASRQAAIGMGHGTTRSQKYFDETAAVRSQMVAKRSELNILMNTSNPDLEKAKALEKEINDLRGKMGQERIKLFAEERKINPDARFGAGWGREGIKGGGFCGGGAGYGRGFGRGFGGGPCWN
jgi:hypothetical protein